MIHPLHLHGDLADAAMVQALRSFNRRRCAATPCPLRQAWQGTHSHPLTLHGGLAVAHRRLDPRVYAVWRKQAISGFKSEIVTAYYAQRQPVVPPPRVPQMPTMSTAETWCPPRGTHHA